MERLQALRKRPVRRSKTTNAAPPESLQLAQYLALHITFAGFLLFSFLFLPRSSSYFGDVVDQRISADRPEHPFLTPLTSSPKSTIMWLDLGVFISVAWWAGHLRAWWDKEKKQGKTALEEVQARNSRSAEIFKAFTAAVASTLGVSLLFHAIMILCGAPFGELFVQTYLISLELALLTTFPVVFALGLPNLYEAGTFDRYRLTRLFCELEPRTAVETATVFPAVGAIVGAWAGVIPLALDWDRPWQSFPLPPAFGAIVGVIIGGLASFTRSALQSLYKDIKASHKKTT